MTTLHAPEVNHEEVNQLSEFAVSFPVTSKLRDFLLAMVDGLAKSEDLRLIPESKELTPAEAAKILGMSRVHVYKIMDSGALPFRRVGTDRRTTLQDVMRYRTSTSWGRRELAERVANPDAVRKAAEAEL